MLNSKQKGNITELQCIAAFYEIGYSVSIPYGDCERYDFIADINGKLIKVQVKTCKEIDDLGTISFSCTSTRVNTRGCTNVKYTANEIDYFATFHKGQCYLVPVSQCSTEKKLRFEAPKNNQKVGINYAKDYELLSQINKIKE